MIGKTAGLSSTSLEFGKCQVAVGMTAGKPIGMLKISLG